MQALSAAMARAAREGVSRDERSVAIPTETAVPAERRRARSCSGAAAEAAPAIPRPRPRPPARSACCWSISARRTRPMPPSVRRYLKEFLTDRRVIEDQGPLWKFILNGIILRVRPRRKARDYRKIWNSEQERVAAQDHHPRADREARRHARPAWGRTSWSTGRCGMAIRRSHRGSKRMTAQGCERILVVPLYPQYCAATTATVGDEVFRVLARMRRQPALRIARALLQRPGLYRGARVVDAGRDRAAAVQARRDPGVVPRHAAGLRRQGRSLLQPLRRDDAAAARAASATATTS